MTTSLSSASLAVLYKQSPDSKRMELIEDVVKDVDYNVFINHPMVKRKFIEKICERIDELDSAGKLKPGQAESLKYMFRNGGNSLKDVLWMCDTAVLDDMVRYVNPLNWKWYQILHHSDGNDYIIVFKNQQNVEGEKELDFQRDIVEAGSSSEPKGTSPIQYRIYL